MSLITASKRISSAPLWPEHVLCSDLVRRPHSLAYRPTGSLGKFHGIRSLDSRTALLLDTIPKENPNSPYAKYPFSTGAFMLINTTVGGGLSLISLPVASRSAGLLLGAILMAIAALTSAFTHSLLVDCRLETGKPTFHELGQLAFGPHFGALCVKGSIALTNFGLCTALFLTVSDGIQRIVASNVPWLPLSKPIILLTAYCAVLPFGLCRRLASLQYVSAFSICCMFAFLLMIIMTLALKDSQPILEGVELVHVGRETALALSLSLLAYSSQFMTLPICNTCPPDDVTHVMPRVICFSMGFCTFLYVGVATVVNLTCGLGPLAGNVLLNYAADFSRHPLTAMTEIAFLFALLFTIPLFNFECRENVDAILFPDEYTDDEEYTPHAMRPTIVGEGRNPPISSQTDINADQYGTFVHGGSGSDDEGDQEDDVDAPLHPPPFRFVSITLLTLLAEMVVAASVQSVDVVLSYIGSTVVVAVMYIFPCAIYLTVTHRNGSKRICAFFLLAFGIVLVPVLVFITTLEAMGMLHGT